MLFSYIPLKNREFLKPYRGLYVRITETCENSRRNSMPDWEEFEQ